MGLDHLGPLAVEAIAVEGVRGWVHLRVKVNSGAGKADANTLGQDGAVLEVDGLEESALGGNCGLGFRRSILSDFNEEK